MEGGMEGWRDGGMEGWRDGGMEGWRDGGMEGWMDGWMDAQMYEGINEYVYVVGYVCSILEHVENYSNSLHATLLQGGCFCRPCSTKCLGKSRRKQRSADQSSRGRGM